MRPGCVTTNAVLVARFLSAPATVSPVRPIIECSLFLMTSVSASIALALAANTLIGDPDVRILRQAGRALRDFPFPVLPGPQCCGACRPCTVRCPRRRDAQERAISARLRWPGRSDLG